MENERERLYWAALTGNWMAIMDMANIQRILTKRGETTLHVAVAANQEMFVRKLLNCIDDDKLADVNNVGNTALTYAAATGNVNIAKLLVDRNSGLLNRSCGVEPLIMAAYSGHIQMVRFLYPRQEVCNWPEDVQVDLFITCVKSDFYGKHKKCFLLFLFLFLFGGS